MATTTNLGKVHVFPSEDSYNTNKGSVGANDLALVPIGTASLSEYGLVRLASEADVLSEGEGAVVHVPLAYELNDFRRMNTAYNVGDKVNCAFRFEFYLECTQAGTTSANALDTRNVTHGQVLTDGTVQWTVRTHIRSINGSFPDAIGNVDVSISGTYVTHTWSEGTEWYRVWSDGFIEQGGAVPNGSGVKIYTKQFVKPFSNVNYTITSSGEYSAGSNDNHVMVYSSTEFRYRHGYTAMPMRFYACGY